MKSLALSLFTTTLSLVMAQSALAMATAPRPTSSPVPTPIDWSQPPVACVEEIVPQKPTRACLDLSTVADPRVDFPEGLSTADLEYWSTFKTALNYCRGREVLRRETAAPGTFSAGSVQLAWMRFVSVNASSDKISAIYQASQEQKMPAQVLAGALMQESLFTSLGIAQDGSNYSCGVGQVNVLEWCQWANKQSPEKKSEMGWPSSGLNCSDLRTTMLKPYYDIAKTRLNGLPEYRLNRSHFEGITLDQVIGGFPTGSEELQLLRHQAIGSFINSCSISRNSIPAKANELKRIFTTFVPSGMRQHDLYPEGSRYQRTCSQLSDHTYKPLATPWLLAVGIYNAGPDATHALAHYNWWDPAALADPGTFKGFAPANLVEGFYWSGQWNSTTDRVHFRRTSGTEITWPWFKSCILQRHIARVVQHTTLPNHPRIIESLEGTFGCSPTKIDPETGGLKTSAPPHRQTSSGRK